MDLERSLDLTREGRHLDESGTPAALIELARQLGRLKVVDEVDEADILTDFPMGVLWRNQTGCSRFARLRRSMDGKDYVLVRAPRAERR